MGHFVFDIETMPHPREVLEAQMPEFSAPGNLRDPLKIEAALQEKRLAYIDKAALSPITSRVCMIGTVAQSRAKDDGVIADYLQPTDWLDQQKLDALEAEILGRFWNSVAEAIGQGMLVVGFNSHGFDLPFLVKRSLRHKVPTLLPPLTGRYPFRPPFLDLAEYWQMGRKEEYTSLDAVARFLGVGEKIGEGKECAGLLMADPDKAVAYLHNDMKLTAGVARRLLY